MKKTRRLPDKMEFLLTEDQDCHFSSLLSSLLGFQDSDSYTNLTLQGEDGGVRCHKAVLASLSPLIWELCTISQETVISLPGVRVKAVQQLLTLVYSGWVDDSSDVRELVGRLKLNIQLSIVGKKGGQGASQTEASKDPNTNKESASQISEKKKLYSCQMCDQKEKNYRKLKIHYCLAHLQQDLKMEYGNQTNSLKCKLCEQTLASKQALYNHIGRKHNKINIILLKRGYQALCQNKAKSVAEMSGVEQGVKTSVGKEEEYEVELILGRRETSNMKEYLVKWKGWEDQADQTWEPAEHLKGAALLVRKFERNKVKYEDNVRKVEQSEPPPGVDDENNQKSSNASQIEKNIRKVKTAKPSQELEQVELEESATYFTCIVCDGSFKNMALLKHHIVKHFSRELNKLVANRKLFTCPECGKRSLNKANLVKHLCWVHRKFEMVTGLSEEDLKPCPLYKPSSTELDHVADEFEDEDIFSGVSVEVGKAKQESIFLINKGEQTAVQEKREKKSEKSQKIFPKVTAKERNKNIQVYDTKPKKNNIPSNSKDANHKVTVTSIYMREETKNRETTKEQTEAVVNNQYLGLCNFCQAILLSQESFKNHMEKHDEKTDKCPSPVNPWSRKPSCDVGEKANLKKSNHSQNICVKCSYCHTVFLDNMQLERHWFKRQYCCLQYNAVSEPVTE